jgi:hypothetical protein
MSVVAPSINVGYANGTYGTLLIHCDPSTGLTGFSARTGKLGAAPIALANDILPIDVGDTPATCKASAFAAAASIDGVDSENPPPEASAAEISAACVTESYAVPAGIRVDPTRTALVRIIVVMMPPIPQPPSRL